MISDGYCFGQNSNGETGNNQTLINTIYYPSYPICNNLELIQISVGNGGHSCGLDKYYQAYCWGSNSRGQLGYSSTSLSNSYCPILVNTTNITTDNIDFLQIVTGNNFTLAIDINYYLYAWGDNSKCNLGIGGTITGTVCSPPSPGYSTLPLLVPTPFKFLNIAAGEYHACGITTQYQLLCWGSNTDGQVSIIHSIYNQEIHFLFNIQYFMLFFIHFVFFYCIYS